MSAAAPASVRVFLSYSWDSPEHKARVLALAQRLRADGIDARLDRFTQFPEEGWARWMMHQIKEARFVIVVATEKYRPRFEGNVPVGEGAGAAWEGLIATQKIYEANGKNEKFLPAIFSSADKAHIPTPLRPFTYFRVDTDDGYDNLYRLLTGQPEIIPAPLGGVRSMPSGTGASPRPLALPALPVHDHPAAKSNLPRLPYGFFGREEELKRIADSLAPDARTWGALIDGPGGRPVNSSASFSFPPSRAS